MSFRTFALGVSCLMACDEASNLGATNVFVEGGFSRVKGKRYAPLATASCNNDEIRVFGYHLDGEKSSRRRLWEGL